MTDALLRAGYTYDKNYKRWFKTVPDENGKLVPDMTKPLTQAEYSEIVSGLNRDDPLGLFPPKTKSGTEKKNKKGNKKDEGLKLPKDPGSSSSDDPAAGHAAMVDWLVDAPGRYAEHLRESGGNEDGYYDPLFDLRY